MRKSILMLIVYIAIVSNSFSQNNYNWITPNKTYLKLFINDDGIYRINSVDFTNAGINPSVINPQTVKVLYLGNQIPIYFQGENDGTFDPNDYFDFYGKRNYGGPTPHRDGFSNSIVYTVNEYYNFYSDTNVYWIEWGGSNGLRMQNSTFVSSINYPDDKYFKRVHFETDSIYYLGETTNPMNDFRYFSTELVVGEDWFWREISTNETLSGQVFINDLSPTAQLCSLKIFVKPVSFTDSVFNEHRIEILVNNNIVDTMYRNNLSRFDTTITFSSSFLSNNTTNSVAIRYIPLGNQYFQPKVHIDFFDLYYQRDFTIRNNELFIKLSGSDSTSKKFTLNGFNSSNPVNIYDIENFTRAENYTSGSNTLTFTGKGNSSFRIVNSDITKKPFRIIQRQVRDLVSSTNSAQYIIVYNKLFESQAEQLRNHRQTTDNFNSIKAEIEDIYDIFNYGVENPVAVRYFLKHAYENWAQPKAEYVCLFGRASLDPKRNSPTSVYYQNFVPTYGNPPTDGYFVNFNLGTFTYYHQISVGRLPVYTTTEAQGVVDKIITYDNQQPEKWWKNFIGITGGSTRNEQLSFQSKSNNLINIYIKPPPVSMQVVKIYRNDSSGYITYDYRDSIKREIDKGVQIINFIGHAANQDWEIGLENPNTLNNGYRQPLVLSFTCYTGKCSETNERSFGENFFLPANKCAIAFLGTTGWSFAGVGDSYNEYILKHYSKDSSRRIGELLSFASQKLSPDSVVSFPSRNTINSYNLMGDPATKLLIPNTPEFEIKQNDYALSNSFPALGETIKLSIFPKNLGTYADTTRVRFQLRKNGIPTLTKDSMLNSFGYIDTMAYFFKVDTSGRYTMSIILDPYKSYPQRFILNDSVIFPLTLRNLSFVPIKPLDNSLLKDAAFIFKGLNPNVNFGANNVKLILQIDTSRRFDSPVLQTYNTTNISGVTTSFNVNIPVQDVNTLYFLRSNAIINNDSSGWSEIIRTIYNPNITDKSKSISDSNYTIFTLKPDQYDPSLMQNVNFSSGGFVLNKVPGTLLVRSHGSSQSEASYFNINNGTTNFTYYSDGAANQGLSIAKIKRFTGIISAIHSFRFSSPQSSDSVLNFLNTFDTTDYMLAYNASYVANADSLRSNAIAKFHQFGCRYIDSLRIGFFDTWAFIGYLNADTSQVCEQFNRYTNNNWTPLICQINPVFQTTKGNISQTFGPADEWKNFSWEQTLPSGSRITFDIYGIERDNTPVQLQSGLTNFSNINIDTIDYFQYPNLRLTANLSIDTVSGSQTPVFNSINFKYAPPAELIPDNNTFTGGDTAVQEGDTIGFSVKYYNVGFEDAGQHINRWYINNRGSLLVLKADTINTPLKIDSVQTSSVKFSTTGLRDPKLSSDTIDLYFETTLTGRKNEIFTFNNTAITKFILQGDTANPVIDITYDGIKIQNGDFIQSMPEVVLKFFDDSRMVINDTSNVKVYLDNKYIPYYINGMPNPLISISFPDNKFLQATVIYKPVLSTGEHKFKFIATDITGNLSDSIVNNVVVNNKLTIFDIANYPNPMKTETDFMFKLSGEFNPTSCKLKIYTVSGRLVREINTPANIGYNIIHWDGKDNDGDYIANGTYLYKFIIQGNSQTETSIQKLAVLR